MDRNGFLLKGQNAQGICAITSVSNFLFPETEPMFAEDINFSCKMQYTKAQLKSACIISNLRNFEIFKNFNTDTYFGQFGNANFNFINVGKVSPNNFLGLGSTTRIEKT